MNAISPKLKLQRQFQKELHGYYQMDGKSNGGYIDGTIYPPDIKQGDSVALEERVDDLSEFLSKKDGITYRPTPEFGAGRIQDRAKVAADASGWVKASAQAALQVATDLIVDPTISAMVKQGLEEVDPQFYTAPSSASGMFHPADEINEGGLALHTARVVQMGEYLGEYFGLDQREQDTLRAGLILHDGAKGGAPWERYANDHGELAGDLIMDLEGPDDVKKTAAQIASNHMAVWRKTSDNAPNPALPDNKMDMITSLADYLAARDDIYLDVPGLDKSVAPTTTAEASLAPQTYAGITKNRDKAFPRGVKITTDKEEITIEVNRKKYKGKINNPEIKDAFLSYGDFEAVDGGRNALEGMDVDVNFWLLKDRKGGKVRLGKGDKSAEYFVWNQKGK